jgi:hypothetical protein
MMDIRQFIGCHLITHGHGDKAEYRFLYHPDRGSAPEFQAREVKGIDCEERRFSAIRAAFADMRSSRRAAVRNTLRRG